MAGLKRRQLLGAGALAAALPSRVFAQTASSARPQLLQGVQAGDFTADGATVWSRSDRPARMYVDYATTESFTDSKSIEGPLALEADRFHLAPAHPRRAARPDRLLPRRLPRSRRLQDHEPAGDRAFPDAAARATAT